MKFNRFRSLYLLADQDLLITGMNRSLAKISDLFLGTRKLEIGSNLLEYIPMDLQKQFRAAYERAYSTGQSHFFNGIFLFPGTRVFDITIDLFPMYDEKGIRVMLFSIRKNMEQDPSQPAESKVLSKYAHITSHKLRAPLSNILSLSESLGQVDDMHFDAQNIRELLSDIRKQAENLDTVIYALNDLIRHRDESVTQTSLSGLNLNDIVLIDDDPFVNRIHEKLIRTQFPEALLHIFTDAAKALDFVLRFPPNLIILDLNMPHFNGWQFLDALGELTILIDVVVVSSSIDPRERKRAFTYKNVKSFLNKPLSQAQLAMTLNPDSCL